MKKIILIIGINIAKFFANFIYLFVKLFPTKNQIVMISKQSDSVTLDFKLIKEALQKNMAELKIVILCKKINNGVLAKIEYCFYMIKIMYYLATSKVCILDGYCIPVSILKHKKGLKIIQIWHASAAVKKFGYQILDKKEGSNLLVAKLMNMHKNYDYLIAPSIKTKKIFAEAFNNDIEKFELLGLPRLEYISNEKYDKTEEILKEYPHLKEKEIILYVPTFRKNEDVNLAEKVIATKIDEEKYNLIISLHPLDNTKVPEKYLIDKKYSSFDLIKVANYIVTDYSALSVEASILEKPIFFYLNDYEEYDNNRGMNIDLTKEVPSFVCENFVEIVDKIDKKEYNMRELLEYKNNYIQIDYKNTIKDMIHFIKRHIN